MNDWRSRPAKRHDDVTISAIRVAFALSLLVHGVALWTYLPPIRLQAPTDAEQGEAGSRLDVKLVPLQGPTGSLPTSPSSPPPQPLFAEQSPSRSPLPPMAAARPPAPKPSIALTQRNPDVPSLPVPPPDAAPTLPRPDTEADLTAYIEARQRARGELPSASERSTSSTPSAEDENERRNRIIAANIGMNNKPSFGKDPKNGGGVFAIKTLEYSFAEFYFYGWNKDIRRNSNQLIEVRKGDNNDIRIAIIRRMIAIVREYESGDFRWESNRLGRPVTLSARQGDSTELEAFLMQEFPEFYDERRLRR